MKDKRKLYFEITILVVSIISILSNFIVFKSYKGLLYFTIYSNILSIIYYLISIISYIFKFNNKCSSFKGMILIFLISTFLIYNLYLLPSGRMHDYDNHHFVSVLIHTICPILVIFDCLLNNPKNSFSKKDIIYWTFGLLLYGLIILIYQLLGGKFLNDSPYPYIIYDYIHYGIKGCIFMNILVYLIFITQSLIVIKINQIKTWRF